MTDAREIPLLKRKLKRRQAALETAKAEVLAARKLAAEAVSQARMIARDNRTLQNNIKVLTASRPKRDREIASAVDVLGLIKEHHKKIAALIEEYEQQTRRKL